MLRTHEQAELDRANKAKVEFNAVVQASGCKSQWHCVQGYTDQKINSFGQYADLIVVRQAEDSGVLSNDISVEDHILIDSARPILFIPFIGATAPIGKRIMVAWNGSHEAIRAISDALPFLRQAELVEVIAVEKSEKKTNKSIIAISQFLENHNVKVQASQVVSRDISVADTLLSKSADHNIDLLVMGAYGHSRVREFIFGGATYNMLKQMTIPVLMSH